MTSIDPRMSPQTARASHARTHQKKSCLRCGSRSRPLAHASVNPLLGLTVPEIVDIGRCVALHGNLCLCNGPASGKSGQPQQRSPVVNSTDVARNSAVTGGNSGQSGRQESATVNTSAVLGAGAGELANL